MATAVENLEKLVLDLPEEQRAHLAASLLDSLPGILSDQDEGVAEALRHDAEIDAHPEQALSFEHWTSRSATGASNAPDFSSQSLGRHRPDHELST